MKTLELLAVGDVSLSCSADHVPFEYVDAVPADGRHRVRQPGVRALRRRRPGGEGDHPACPSRTRGVPAAGGLQRREPGEQPCAGLRFRRADPDLLRPAGAGHSVHRRRGRRSRRRGTQIIECRGLKVGFLAYGDTDACHVQDGVFVNRIDRETILDQLRSLKPQCDVAGRLAALGHRVRSLSVAGADEAGQGTGRRRGPTWCSAIIRTWSRGSSGSDRRWSRIPWAVSTSSRCETTERGNRACCTSRSANAASSDTG